MFEILRKISAVFLALLVLCSTLSFTVDQHYCGDHLVSASLLASAKKCAMHSNNEKNMHQNHSDMSHESTKSSHCEAVSYQKSCCDDEQLIFEGQDELTLSFEDLNGIQKIVLSSFTYSYVYLFSDFSYSLDLGNYHPPPDIVENIQVQYCTFLI